MKNKRLIIYCIVLIFTFCLFQYSFAFQNEPAGFRNIKWGSSLAGVKEMILKQDDGYVKTYTKKDENLLWNEISVNSIDYLVLEDKFFRVKLKIERVTTEKINKIKEKLIKRFSYPTEQYTQGNEIVWKGEISEITFSYDETTKNAIIILYWPRITHYTML